MARMLYLVLDLGFRACNFRHGKSFSDKKLFTPGPLTSSASVKSAMLRDLGSRDAEFIATIQSIRDDLLKVADVQAQDWTTVPMQGSGTFAVEAVLQTAIPRKNGKVRSSRKSLNLSAQNAPF